MKLNKSIYRILIIIFLLGLASTAGLTAQPVPGVDENIPFLVTFGKQGETSWGDDHFYQIWFFTIPADFKQQIYIRVFDPDCGGEWDEIQGNFNTRTLFSVFGGKGVDPDKNEDSRGLLIGLNYKEGNLLSSRVFGGEARYDNKYFTFGPFNPAEGDYSEKWNSYVFKIVCEGVSGDDGNLYRYFLSRDPDNNIPVEGANAFTYEYTFRMWNNFKSVAHIYPFIDTGIVSVKQSNFDWDNDGSIIVVSRYKQGIPVPISSENNWVNSTIPVEPAEVNSSLDFQFHKLQEKDGGLVKNNNVVITLQNQRGDALQFYSFPIGGVPVYQPKTNITKIPPKK
jgi:hypothetical protein